MDATGPVQLQWRNVFGPIQIRGGKKQKTVCLLIENAWYNEEFGQKPWNHSGVTRMKALAHSKV
jgi:hypothetical protein